MPYKNNKCENIIEQSGKIFQHGGETFVLINEIGLGAYASVWMCYSVNKKELYAIKIFKQKEKNVAKKEILLQEHFKKMGIKNTVNAHASFEHGGQICIVFDLMAGSLYDLIEKGGMDNGVNFKLGFDIDFVIKCVYQVLQTIADLHDNNIIHGDIKPENILLYGRTKKHNEIINSFLQKTSIKKISETARELSKTFIKINQDSEVDNSNDDTCGSDSNDNSDSDGSEMSNPPKMIMWSDTETNDDVDNDIVDNDIVDNVVSGNKMDDDNNKMDDDNNETDDDNNTSSSAHYIMKHLCLPKKFIVEPIVKLSDMGACVNKSDNKKPIGVQTIYYKSPEIILGLEYGVSCDMWALGCTIYELLTGKILFNPDNYDMDKKRCMLHQMYACVGKIPENMISDSPYKQVFFTNEHILKGSWEDKKTWATLLRHTKGGDLIKKLLLSNLLFDMLRMNPEHRISASNALRHPLFFNGGGVYCAEEITCGAWPTLRPELCRR